MQLQGTRAVDTQTATGVCAFSTCPPFPLLTMPAKCGPFTLRTTRVAFPFPILIVSLGTGLVGKVPSCSLSTRSMCRSSCSAEQSARARRRKSLPEVLICSVGEARSASREQEVDVLTVDALLTPLVPGIGLVFEDAIDLLLSSGSTETIFGVIPFHLPIL